MAGFVINEIMTGTHRFTAGAGPGGEFGLHFSLTWGNRSILRFLNPFSPRFNFALAKGFVTAGGLADKADCTGTLRLMYFTENKIRYVFTFKDDAGRKYRYTGEKRNIKPWNLHRTHVTCYGTITDLGSGRVISESVVCFPMREMLPFLCSCRIRKGRVFEYADAGERREDRPRLAVLSEKEAKLIAAFAGALIPSGGASFAEGAADLAEKWLPRVDYALSRTPAAARRPLLLALKLVNIYWPLRHLRRFMPLSRMVEPERTALLENVENAGSSGILLFLKALIFPAFYGLKEVKEAIGYRERFGIQDRSAAPAGKKIAERPDLCSRVRQPQLKS